MTFSSACDERLDFFAAVDSWIVTKLTGAISAVISANLKFPDKSVEYKKGHEVPVGMGACDPAVGILVS
jgi:hypothetical protein